MMQLCESLEATIRINFGTVASEYKPPAEILGSTGKASTTRNSGGLLYAPGGHGFGGFSFVSVGRAARRCAGRVLDLCFFIHESPAETFHFQQFASIRTYIGDDENSPAC